MIKCYKCLHSKLNFHDINLEILLVCIFSPVIFLKLYLLACIIPIDIKYIDRALAADIGKRGEFIYLSRDKL